MRKKFYIPKSVLLIALTVQGCITGAPQQSYTAMQSTTPAPTGTPIEITDAMKQLARAGVTTKLRDPESARFGDMVAARLDNGGVVICGYVNAKNAMGGFTGMSPFVGGIDAGRVHVLAVGGTWQQSMEAYNGCAAAGLLVEERNRHWAARR